MLRRLLIPACLGLAVMVVPARAQLQAPAPFDGNLARLEGIDGDCLAQTCLFAAFAEFVSTYGEEAVARFAEGLPVRIRNGEFSLALAKQ